jgi:3-phosphoglycerate kinase
MLRKKYRKLKDIKEEAVEEDEEINKKQVDAKDDEDSKKMHNNFDDSMVLPTDHNKNGQHSSNSLIHRSSNPNDTSRFNDSRYSSSGG